MLGKYKIGIDARTIVNRRGIGNFVFHLLAGLSKIPFDCNYIIYLDNHEAIKFVPKDPRFITKIVRPSIYPIWEQFSLLYRVIKDKVDILHCPGNSAPLLLPKKIKLVLSIMDVMYMFPEEQLPKSPSLYQLIGRKYLKYLVPHVARRASAITTISSTSREDILKYIKGVERDQIPVIFLAANEVCKNKPTELELDQFKSKFKLDFDFILTLGAIDPRKNTALVLHTFYEFRKLHLSEIKLVILGLSSIGIEKFSQLAKKLEIYDDVVFIGFVSDSDLVAFYNLATVFIYPSLYEGFGLPVLEAMSCGTPVITSTSGSIPEIAGDAALMVNPISSKEIAYAIKLFISNEQLRLHFVDRGRLRASTFSWQRAAFETFGVYQSLINNR